MIIPFIIYFYIKKHWKIFICTWKKHCLFWTFVRCKKLIIFKSNPRPNNLWLKAMSWFSLTRIILPFVLFYVPKEKQCLYNELWYFVNKLIISKRRSRPQKLSFRVMWCLPVTRFMLPFVLYVRFSSVCYLCFSLRNITALKRLPKWWKFNNAKW